MCKLSRSIPARTKTVRFRWVKQEFMEICPKYRAIRAKCGSPMDACFWCKHKFEDGEMMALAARDNRANVVLCQTCATAAKATS